MSTPGVPGEFYVITSSADQEGGGQWVRTPSLKITSYMGFYRDYAIGPPGKSWTPPPGKVAMTVKCDGSVYYIDRKMLDPLWNLKKL